LILPAWHGNIRQINGFWMDSDASSPSRGCGTHLGHLFANFADIVQQENDNFWREYGHRAHICEPWTKRSIIRDEIVHLLGAFTDGLDEAFWRRQGNGTYFYYFNEFIIKVNKLDDFLCPNINDSQISRAYFTQQPDLFCMEEQNGLNVAIYLEPTTIFLGYVPTENNPRVPQSYLVCFNDRGALEWDIPLQKGPAPAPVETVPPVEGDEPPRVRMRPAAKKIAG
jgi:hypothetical protein